MTKLFANIILAVAGLVVVANEISAQTNSRWQVPDWAAKECNEMHRGTLRHGNNIDFFSSLSNGDSDEKIFTRYKITAKEQYDYNGSTTFPSFAWTPIMVESGFALPPKTDNVVALKAESSYPVKHFPPARHPENLVIKYEWEYYRKGETTLRTIVACVFYDVSWCGDGEVDKGEPCDPQAEPWKTLGNCRVNTEKNYTCELKSR
jgi:hypothetical protein